MEAWSLNFAQLLAVYSTDAPNEYTSEPAVRFLLGALLKVPNPSLSPWFAHCRVRPTVAECQDSETVGPRFYSRRRRGGPPTSRIW